MAPESRARRDTIRDSLGVGFAVGLYGAAFGAAGTAAGLAVWQSCALSLLMFTGASQFAFIGVLGAGGDPLAAVGSALLLGVRNSLYGLRLAGDLQVRGVRRAVAAHGVIDETTAMSVAQPSPEQARLAFWVTGISLFTVWNLTTVIAAVGARFFGDSLQVALSAVVPAAFLALLWPRLRAGWTPRVVALGGAIIALALTPVVPAGVQVILAIVAVILGVRRAL